MTKNVQVIFDRRGLATKTGKGTIEIRVYLKAGERRYESMGISTPDKWEVEAQSKHIMTKVKHYEQVINAMKIFNEDMTIDNFNKHIFQECAPKKPDETHLYKGHDQRQSFVDYCEDCFEKEDLRKNSRKSFIVTFESLRTSGILKTFADLTPANILAYDTWLRQDGKRKDVTIYGYHKKIRKYTRMLWRSEMIASDPYDHVKIVKGTYKERVPLTEAELLKLRNAKLTGRLDRVRDLFIFCAYTGLAYCDMQLFDFNTMTDKVGDYYYIDGSRLKTGSKFYTPILPPALEVLKKYNYELPRISNQKGNDYLHMVEEKLEIHKSCTFHIARHSFATLMLNYDVPVENVARMLGHRNIKTTQIYAKISKKTIEKRTEKLVEAIQ